MPDSESTATGWLSRKQTQCPARPRTDLQQPHQQSTHRRPTASPPAPSAHAKFTEPGQTPASTNVANRRPSGSRPAPRRISATLAKSRTFTTLTNKWPTDECPHRSTVDGSRPNAAPADSSGNAGQSSYLRQTGHRPSTASLPAPLTCGNGMTMKPGHTSGLQQPRQLTAHGPPTGSLPAPATAATCHPDVQTHFGPLPFSPADGLRAHCPQPAHRRLATDHCCRCRRCCHRCRSPANLGSFPRQDAPLPS